jgi:diguanylate cyclase (GGDEF)-like protein
MNRVSMRLPAWRRVLALLLLLAAGGALAQSVPIVVERLDRDLPDAAAAQLVAGAWDADFVAEPYAAITPSPRHGRWYRIYLDEDWRSSRPPVLAIADPHGLALRAYVPPDYAPVERSLYERDDATGFTRHALVFMLPALLSARAPIYLHVAPERAVPRAITVTDVTQARIADLVRARLDVLFPAIQLATVLVMLSFVLALRERVYVYFVAGVLLLVLYECYAFGIGYELWPLKLLAPLGARAAWLSASLAGLMLIEFSRHFLELPRDAARLDRVLAALRWPLLAWAVCAALPALSPGWWIEVALALTLLLMAPLLIGAGLLAWLRGGRSGGYYLGAWVPGLLFVIVRTLQLLLHWPLPAWLEFALPAAFALASLVLSFGLADSTLSIRYERDVANRLADHDALTGVLNRRAILARLRAAFLHARAARAPLALLFLDLDHFKRINDSYGHRAGDQCLRAVIAPIAGELRLGDALGRYGGEEFLVVLPGADAPNAQLIAERIRHRVERMPLLVSGTRISLTVSIGVAALDAEVATPEMLVERADGALYRSKANGRNVVTMHSGRAAV